MGIIIPRPAMRAKERRVKEQRLRDHAKLMQQFQAEGMSRAEASRKAYQIVTKSKSER